MATKMILVPDSPGPGEWVDCADLGTTPLAQLTRGATAADQVRIETAADGRGTMGIIASSEPLVAARPVVVDQPISWVRAVRVGGATTGLQVVIRSTNAGRAAGRKGLGEPARDNPNRPPPTTMVDGDAATAAVVAS